MTPATNLLKSATERLRSAIRDVEDFPKKGIVFKDITPILENGQLFRLATTLFSDRYQRRAIDKVVAIDARGFIFASSVAYCLGCGIALVRKRGKLPGHTLRQTYDLEYGSNTLEIHDDSIQKGEKVVIIDDLLATGGTIKAACDLVGQLGGEVVETAVLVELSFLEGRKVLEPHPVFSIISY